MLAGLALVGVLDTITAAKRHLTEVLHVDTVLLGKRLSRDLLVLKEKEPLTLHAASLLGAEVLRRLTLVIR